MNHRAETITGLLKKKADMKIQHPFEVDSEVYIKTVEGKLSINVVNTRKNSMRLFSLSQDGILEGKARPISAEDMANEGEVILSSEAETEVDNILESLN